MMLKTKFQVNNFIIVNKVTSDIMRYSVVIVVTNHCIVIRKTNKA